MLEKKYQALESKQRGLKPLEKMTLNVLDYDVSGGKDEVMQRVARAHQELRDYFAKLDKSGENSSSHSTAEDPGDITKLPVPVLKVPIFLS